MRFRAFAAKFSIFFALGLVLASAPAAKASELIDRMEATVNSSIILHTDVQKFRQTVRLRSQLDPLFAGTSVAAAGEKASNSEIVDFLITERLISQAFPVTDTEVEQEITSIQSNNHIDRSQLRTALAGQGFTFDDYFELIRSSASKRNLIDRDIRTKVSISDDDVKNYFYNHYSRATSASKIYHLQVIHISLKSFKTYAAAKDAADTALKNVRSGEAFEEVAKRSSDDPSASSGGDLGVLSDEQISPAFREQLKNLQIGGVSPVFGGQSAGGFTILKLLDVKSDDAAQIDKRKDEIRSQLLAVEYQHQIALWLERQRQTAFIHRAGEPAIAGMPAAR